VDLSVVIVSYNVRRFLEQALRSVFAALEGLEGEVWVVDNASSDGSVQMVREQFPQVKLIANEENVGFARANNQAIAQARGRYVLLLNPDTVVRKDTFRIMVKFMDEHPEAGAAGCKVLNPDGTLQLACRRGFPTPMVAFYKIVGLSSLFPKSRRFGRYNMTYLNPDEVAEVDAVSGSFMMVRREVVEKVGVLDPSFFMYGEDIDWCYRIKQAGWKVYYVPYTEIVHFKGESTKTVPRVRNQVEFYRAMYLFVRKHLKRHFIPHWVLTAGIVLRGTASLMGRGLHKVVFPTVDFVLSLTGLTLGILTRFGYFYPLPPYRDIRSYIIVYGACGVAWVGALWIAGAYGPKRYSPLRAFLGTFLGFLAVTSAPFFWKEYAFSRLVALYALIYNGILIPGWRVFLGWIGRRSRGFRFGRKRALVVGMGQEGVAFLRTVRDHPELGYDVVGVVSDGSAVGGEVEGVKVIGTVEDLPELVRSYQVDEIVVTTSSVPYSQVFEAASRVRRTQVAFKLVPTSFEDLAQEMEQAGELLLIDLEVPRKVWRRLRGRS